MESYEGYLGSGVNGNVWGKCVGRVMWPVCGVVKKMERLRKEVLARIVEVNLLLSIARYVVLRKFIFLQSLTVGHCYAEQVGRTTERSTVRQ